jgi:hypothetical protein
MLKILGEFHVYYGMIYIDPGFFHRLPDSMGEDAY